jgi:NAD+ synthase
MVNLEINGEAVRRILTGFIANEVRKTGFSRVVVGLSGGIDSALSAYLAAEALGPANVFAVLMPYRTSNPESAAHADLVVRALGIESLTVEITAMLDAYFAIFPDADQMRRGNKMARERMTILFDHSARLGALVLGTSNKTELLLGYGTLHGDMASAVNPLGDLYKTQVRALAGHLRVPAAIRKKPPSADLWPRQSDEADLGFTYERVDRLLALLVDARLSRDAAVAAGFDRSMVDRVARLVVRSQFKRRPPIIAKVSARTVGWDFRYPRDWKS